MHITFGLDLDGYRSPRPENRAGEVTIGPSGLLTILETQLGMTDQRINAPVRIGEYLHCLRSCDNGSRFYSKSFAVDAFGVSKTLLFWRDSWVEAGWDQQSEKGNHPILIDLTAVEEIARKELSPGFCDRLRRVLVSLEKRNGLVLNIALMERREELPPVWKKIVNLLVVDEEDIGQVMEVLAESETDLARLQESILHNTPCDMTGDGTVLLFRAHSEQVLSKALVQYLYAGEDRNRTTLIPGNSGELFDMALAAQDHPLVGSAAHSHWRPTFRFCLCFWISYGILWILLVSLSFLVILLILCQYMFADVWPERWQKIPAWVEKTGTKRFMIWRIRLSGWQKMIRVPGRLFWKRSISG